MDKKQQKMINFRADEETREKLQFLADLTQRTQSNWLRWIIEHEWRKLNTTQSDDGDPGRLYERPQQP